MKMTNSWGRPVSKRGCWESPPELKASASQKKGKRSRGGGGSQWHLNMPGGRPVSERKLAQKVETKKWGIRDVKNCRA